LQGSNPPQLPRREGRVLRPRCYGHPDKHHREGVHVLPHAGRGPNFFSTKWDGRASACSSSQPMAHGEFRNIQRPMSKDDLQESCRAGGAQASGECWSVVPGLVCVEDGPLQKINFGHSGIFLNNTSPDPDASLPNPALQRLFDVRVFSSRANENAPASKGSRSNAAAFALCLASSQHAHLFLLLLLLLFVVTDPPPPPLPPPSRSPGSGTPPTARPVAGFRVSSRTSCLVRPFPGWRCWIPNPLLI
jgi:hypothetical protein